MENVESYCMRVGNAEMCQMSVSQQNALHHIVHVKFIHNGCVCCIAAPQGRLLDNSLIRQLTDC